MDMEDVPDMSIRKPVSTHPKCGPMGRKPTVLISLSDTQVYPMATPDATGDSMMTWVFIQSYQFPENASSAAETVSRQCQNRNCTHLRKQYALNQESPSQLVDG